MATSVADARERVLQAALRVLQAEMLCDTTQVTKWGKIDPLFGLVTRTAQSSRAAGTDPMNLDRED